MATVSASPTADMLTAAERKLLARLERLGPEESYIPLEQDGIEASFLLVQAGLAQRDPDDGAGLRITTIGAAMLELAL